MPGRSASWVGTESGGRYRVALATLTALPAERVQLRRAIRDTGLPAWKVGYLAGLSSTVLSHICTGRRDVSTEEATLLYPALKRAGIARLGPTGEKRTFHSFRHTFAKRALESGRPIFWLSRHLGHSSADVTTECYGHWEPAERKREAELMAGVFGV